MIFHNIDNICFYMKEYKLLFEGYWRDINKSGLPTYSGIYLVYKCVYNARNDTVSLIDIIYIGQAENIHDRHIKHEKYAEFLSQLVEGQELCYSCAPVESDINLLENALIFAQRPVLNVEGRNSYNYTKAHIILSGQCTCMKYTNYNIG